MRLLRAAAFTFLAMAFGGLLAGCEAEPEISTYDAVVGDGDKAEEGMWARVDYTAWLTNDTVVDSTSADKPLTFRIGYGVPMPEGGYSGLIEGFDMGVRGMREGGIRRITIPPELGYGGRARGCDDQGQNCAIPPNSTLIFEVELLATWPPAEATQS